MRSRRRVATAGDGCLQRPGGALRVRARTDPSDVALVALDGAAATLAPAHGRRAGGAARRAGRGGCARDRASPLPAGRGGARRADGALAGCAPPSSPSRRSPSKTPCAPSTRRARCCRPSDAEGAVRVVRLRARALRGLGRVDEALAALSRCLAVAPAGAERDAVLQARARLQLDLFRGRDAIADLDPLARADARESGDRAREAELLLMRSRGLYILLARRTGVRGADAHVVRGSLRPGEGDRRHARHVPGADPDELVHRLLAGLPRRRRCATTTRRLPSPMRSATRTCRSKRPRPVCASRASRRRTTRRCACATAS